MSRPALREGLARLPLVFLAGLLVLAPVAVAGTVAATTPIHPAATGTTGSVTVDITATTDLSFDPSSFTVTPGESVTLVVTQGADFAHTFTLSSVVNFTIPASDSPSQVAAFFNAHPPLVNLSLGSTAGSQQQITFTAPTSQGTYEFVCLIHFPQMTGIMTDSSAAPSSGGSGSALSITEIVAIGAGVGVVVIAAAAFLVLRGRRPPK